MLPWQIALLTAAGLALLVTLVELALRAWFRASGATYVWQPYGVRRLVIDQDALPTLEPIVEQRFNGDGERGDDVPRSWRDTYRVLVVGGSAAECYFLDQASTWPAVVERELRRPDALARLDAAGVHVGSIARSLVPCETICRMLSSVLHRYERLDLVLVMVGASDAVQWLQAGTPERAPENAIPLEDVFAERAEGPWAWTVRRSAIRRLLSRWRARLTRPVEVRERAGGTFVKLRRMRAEAKTLVDEVPDPAPMVDGFERWFRELLGIARSKAKRVVVVRQPWFDKEHDEEERARLWNFGRGHPHLEQVDTYYTHAVVAGLYRVVDARVAAVADELGLEHVDLMPHLERSWRTYYDYNHFTPAGADAVGRSVAERVLDGG